MGGLDVKKKYERRRCKRNHYLSGRNVYWHKGKRSCLSCRKAYRRLTSYKRMERKYPGEIWKNVPYAKKYMVSNYGRVLSVFKYPPKLLKSAKTNKYGHVHVNIISDDGDTLTRTIHKLVMESFICMRPDGMVINHKNSIPDDNKLDNLEYVTASKNIRHAYITGNARRKLTIENIKEIRELRKKGETLVSIAKKFGIVNQMVSSIELGHAWSYIK